MDRVIRWAKPTSERNRKVRLSKCGTYRITTRPMASGRAGYWNARQYELELVTTGQLIGQPCETLRDAMELAEMNNDNNWEPSGC